MSQLEKDIDELCNEVVTKKDVIAGLKIIGELVGFGGVLYAVFMAVTVWIPGFGIPISSAAAVHAMRTIATEYPNLPKDQRRIVAKCAKFLTGIIN
jgi:hypothetical protein